MAGILPPPVGATRAARSVQPAREPLRAAEDRGEAQSAPVKASTANNQICMRSWPAITATNANGGYR
jgi:hypothetical protein